jgi:16S rRNA (uracil1498-N3)-methyltransferase
MHRHFLPTDRLTSARLALDRAEARHLQTVLRAKVGEAVELFDGAGLTVAARVAAADRGGLALEPLAAPRRHPPPACRLALFASICKGPRMDWMIEKAVELGASRIVPVGAGRSVGRPGDDAGRVARWRRVALEAARQCGTAWLPAVDPPQTFAAACAALPAWAPVFVAALAPGTRPLRETLAARCASGTGTPATAGWLTGPEGDFTPEELRQAIAAGAIPVSLGRNVLRAETAAIYGLCVLGAEWL